MMNVPQETVTDDDTSSRPMAIVWNAACLGLVVSLFELGLLLAFKRLRDPSPGFFRMNRHVVWMIPTFDLTLFVLAGLVLALITRFRPRFGSRLTDAVLTFLSLLILILTYRPLFVLACLVLALGLTYRLVPVIRRRRVAFRRVVRWTFPAIALLVVALAGGSFYRNVVKASRLTSDLPMANSGGPNVLLIVLDTARADRLSLYGYERPTTPNLEELATQGICFERARSTAPWTLPSHASIMTGRWPHQLSAHMDGPLDATHPTLAEFLARNGYATGGFVGNLTYASAETGLARGFDIYDDHDISPAAIRNSSTLFSRLWPMYARKDTAQISRELLGWLDKQPDSQPFFAFLNLFDAHDPYLPPPGSTRHFGIRPESNSDLRTINEWFILRKAKLSPRQIQLVNDGYDDCLASLDDNIGRLLDDLERRGDLANTLVIVTADHGEHFGEHGLYGHASSLYNQEIHVPLLIVPPRSLPAARTITPSVSLRDIPATVAELTGLSAASPFPGQSLARYWSADADVSSLATTPILSEIDRPAQASPNQGRSPVFRGAMKSLVADEKVYIRNGDGVEELYDLANDPSQSNDLAAVPEFRPILERFRTELRQLFPELRL